MPRSEKRNMPFLPQTSLGTRKRPTDLNDGIPTEERRGKSVPSVEPGSPVPTYPDMRDSTEERAQRERRQVLKGHKVKMMMVLTSLLNNIIRAGPTEGMRKLWKNCPITGRIVFFKTKCSRKTKRQSFASPPTQPKLSKVTTGSEKKRPKKENDIFFHIF